MQLQKKHNQCRCNTQVILLPITGALFIKKPVPEKSSEESSLDFHLTIIKKIDELLHDKETTIDAPAAAESQHVAPREPPVEPRPQLGRRVDHVEIDLPSIREPSLTKNQSIPEEFKIDPTLDVEPEFRFITSLDSLEHAIHINPHERSRIEVIDLGDFTTDDVSSHLTTPTIHIQPSKQSIKIKEPARIKKIEVIEMQTLMQQTPKDVFLRALSQNEEIEKKSQIYYLNSAGHKDVKIKRKENEQSYVPEDFEERVRKLKEKQEQEEQEKKKQEEIMQKQLEKEQEKQTKLDTKKIKIDEKKQLKEKEQKEPKKEPQPLTELLTKKQLKEQKRLQKIEARKARIEERKKRKEEKQALKEQQKQQPLSHHKLDKKQKSAKEKKGKKQNLFKKEKPVVPSTEIDEEIKKVIIMTDSLLGELPEDIINRFAQSDDFELYQRVLSKYKIK